MTRLTLMLALIATLATSVALAQEPKLKPGQEISPDYDQPRAIILKQLPHAVQKEIESIRTNCRDSFGGKEDLAVSGLDGDDGLETFTVSGADAVLVDELAFCGGECHHGVNCATGFTHDIAIYIRSGKSWRKALSVWASGPTFLDTDDNGKFNAFVLRVFAGDKGCQARRSPIIESRQTCARVLRWDEKAKQFVYKPL